jgi:hypothetical protein
LFFVELSNSLFLYQNPLKRDDIYRRDNSLNCQIIKLKANMKYEPQQVLTQFESQLKQALKATFLEWQVFHSQKLDQLQKILDPLKVHLVHSAEWTDIPVELWQELEEALGSVCTWINENHYVPEDLTVEHLCKSWYNEFDKILDQTPEEIRIIPGETYWHSQKGDSIYIRTRKRFLRIGRWFTARKIGIVNIFRKILKKQTVSLPKYERLIPLRNFASHFIQTPLTEFTVDEWQRFMQAVSGQLFVMQAKNAELSDRALLLERFSDILNPEEKVNIFDELFLMAEVLKHTDETLQALNGYDRQFNKRLDTTWEEIRSRFETYWHRTDTFRFKTKLLNNERQIKLRVKVEETFKRYVIQWRKHWHGLREDWIKDLKLSALQLHVARWLVKISRSLYKKVHTEIEPKYKHLFTKLKITETSFAKINSLKQLQEHITEEKSALLRDLPRKMLPEILDTIQQNRLVELLDSFSENVTEQVEDLAEEYYIYLHKDTSNIPPRSRIENVPLKEIVETEIVYNLLQTHSVWVLDAKERLEKIYRMISEIDQVIEFNFEAAQNLLLDSPEHKYEEAKKIILDGFTRTANLVNELSSNTSEIAEKSTERMREHTLIFEKEIQSLSDNDRVYSLKVRLTRAKTRQRMRELSKETLLRIRNFLPVIFVFLKRIWNQYIRFRKITGLEKSPQIIEDQLADFLSESERQITRLPYVYQRLFRFEPLGDERFFAGRDKEIQLLQNEFRNWNTEKNALTALIGERGSGRTTLINFALKKVFSGKETLHIDFQKSFYDESKLLPLLKQTFKNNSAKSLTELEQTIADLPNKQICIVENMQNVFLKVVNGFSALEVLLSFMTQTQDNVFWVVTCTLYSWKYLDKVINIARYFHKVITLGPLKAEEIETVILKRHRVSGFLLEFSYFDELSKYRKFRKRTSAEAKQKFLEDYYFNTLNELSEGNITVAMFFWLRSIKQFTRDRVEIKTELKFDFEFLNQLPDEDLFSLGAIFLHETLDIENHARMFHQLPEASSLHLNRLYRFGFLEKSANGFRINPLLYRPLERTLKGKNILH